MCEPTVVSKLAYLQQLHLIISYRQKIDDFVTEALQQVLKNCFTEYWEY